MPYARQTQEDPQWSGRRKGGRFATTRDGPVTPVTDGSGNNHGATPTAIIAQVNDQLNTWTLGIELSFNSASLGGC